MSMTAQVKSDLDIFYDNPPLEEDGFYCPAVDVSMSSLQSVQAHKTNIK